MTTSVSTLGQALSQISRIKDQQLLFSSLTTQLATGKKTQKFSGLNTDVLTSKRSRADMRSLDTYISNITNSSRRIELMSTTVQEFKAQAENFLNALVGFTQESAHQKGEVVEQDDPATDVDEDLQIGHDSAQPDDDFQNLIGLANNITNFLEDLLNAQDGDRYLLNGADTLTKPYENSGLLDAAVSSLVKGWKGGTITTQELIADFQDRTTATNPNALTDTIVGYTAALSAGNVDDVFVRVDANSELKYTALANDQAFRDVLVAASFFRNENTPPIADAFDKPYTFGDMPVADGAPGTTLEQQKDNFFKVFNGLAKMVTDAVDRLDAVSFRLESVRARINEIEQSHVAQKNLFQNTISDIEDADTNEVAVRINLLQLTLDASFRVTARLQELTLSNFL